MKILTLTLEEINKGNKKIWMVKETGEREEMIKKLFGTNKIPSPFYEPSSAEEVKQRLQALNTDATIIIEETEKK